MHLWRIDSWMRLSLPSSPMNLMLPSILIFAIARCSSSSEVSGLSCLSKSTVDWRRKKKKKKKKSLNNSSQKNPWPNSHFVTVHSYKCKLLTVNIPGTILKLILKLRNQKPSEGLQDRSHSKSRQKILNRSTEYIWMLKTYTILLLCCLTFCCWGFKVWCIFCQA